MKRIKKLALLRKETRKTGSARGQAGISKKQEVLMKIERLKFVEPYRASLSSASRHNSLQTQLFESVYIVYS